MAPRFRLIPMLLLCVVPQVAFGADVDQAAGESLKVLPGGILAQAKLTDVLKTASQKQDGVGAQASDQYSELRFGGIEPDGTIVLFSKAFQGTQNARSISRNQMALANPNANPKVADTSESTTSNQLSGRTNAQSGATGSFVQVAKGPGDHVVVPADSLAMRLPKGTEKVTFGDKTIEIIYVGPESLTYRLGAVSSAQTE